MTKLMFDRIAEFIRNSDLPRKEQKLDGLKSAYLKRHPLTLVGDMLLLDGIAIDPSELENGFSMRDVQLTTGERLGEPEERDDGVMTDAGLIPWDMVEGFWSFHKATGRWMFVPL